MSEVLVEIKVLLNLCRDTPMAVELVRMTSMVSLYFDLPIAQFPSITVYRLCFFLGCQCLELKLIQADDSHGGCVISNPAFEVFP